MVMLQVLMFTEDEMQNMRKLLAAILHIGNLRFRGEHMRLSIALSL